MPESILFLRILFSNDQHLKTAISGIPLHCGHSCTLAQMTGPFQPVND